MTARIQGDATTDCHSRTRRVSWQRRAWVASVVSVSSLAACKVSLIGEYDDSIDRGVTDVQQAAETYFTTLKSTPTAPFDRTFYDGMRSRLIVLSSRATLLPKYPVIVQQLSGLQREFDDFRQLDSMTRRPVSASFVAATENGVTVAVEAILKLELALKRGESPPQTVKP